MNQLYPLKFTPIFKEKIWGGNKLNTILKKKCDKNKKIGESWEISGVNGSLSIIENGFLAGNNLEEIIEIYMGDLVGDKVYNEFGLEFPLLIKFIDANNDLSIQVHPNDELALERHRSLGKTEMWYILQADENAQLISGFNQPVDQELYINKLNSNQLTSILNFEKAKKDDVFFIPAGRIHAICKGIVVAEIQQTSDITYRIFDWNRLDDNGNSRELHTDLALDAIDYNFHENYRTSYEIKSKTTSNIIDNKYFTTNIIDLNNLLEKDYNFLDSFIVYICLNGRFTVDCEFCSPVTIETGETLLIPAILRNLTLQPISSSKVLEIYIK